jgi:hypothetical protein
MSAEFYKPFYFYLGICIEYLRAKKGLTRVTVVYLKSWYQFRPSFLQPSQCLLP